MWKIVALLFLNFFYLYPNSNEENFEKSKKLAILVGVNNYEVLESNQNIKLSLLTKSKEDVKLMSQLLKKSGYDTIELTEIQDQKSLVFPDKSNLEKVFEKSLKNKDMVLFFFSGHGMDDYIFLKDKNSYTNPENYQISIQKILEILYKNGVKKSLLLIDSCRDFYANKSFKEIKYTPPGEVDYYVIYSTSSGTKSYEEYRFARFIDNYLKASKSKTIHLKELMDYLDEEISKESKQKQNPKILTLSQTNNTDKFIVFQESKNNKVIESGKIIFNQLKNNFPVYYQYQNKSKWKASLLLTSFLISTTYYGYNNSIYSKANSNLHQLETGLLFLKPNSPVELSLSLSTHKKWNQANSEIQNSITGVNFSVILFVTSLLFHGLDVYQTHSSITIKGFNNGHFQEYAMGYTYSF